MKAGDGVAWESDDEGGECTCVCVPTWGLSGAWGLFTSADPLAPTTSYHNTTLTSRLHNSTFTLYTYEFFFPTFSLSNSSVG